VCSLPRVSYGNPPPPDDPSGGQQPPAQPPYGQPPYGQPPYGQPAYGGAAAPTHGPATTSLILGILSFVCCGLLGIPAYIIGRRAEREIAASGGRLGGEGLAKAGWILGLVSIALMVVGLLAFVLLFAAGTGLSVGTGY